MRESFFSRFLARLLPAADRDELTGDLAEMYARDRARRGPLTARAAWLREAVALVVRARTTRLRTSAGRQTDSFDPGRAFSWLAFTGGVAQDVRIALRGFARAPGFTTVAVVTLALGIGANSAVFSVVDAVLLRPLPFADAEALVYMERVPLTRWPAVEPQPALAASPAFAAIGAYIPGGVNVGGGAEPERANAAGVNAGFFQALGVPPLAGRTVQPADFGEGAPRVAVIGERLWRRRFGGSPAAVGGPIVLNGNVFTIAGVMPARMDFPSRTEIWVPFWTERQLGGAAFFARVIARLAPGVTPSQASVELDRVWSIQERESGYRPDDPSTVTPLRDWIVGTSGPIVLLVAAGVALVLLVACLNTANLLLARVASRDRELMVRRALGAGGGRLVRQLFTEHLTLAVIAGVLALAVARWALGALHVLLPSNLHGADAIALDARVLAVAAVLVVTTAAVFGAAPAISALTGSSLGALRSGSHSGGSRAWRRFRAGLVIMEVAVALVLIVGAGLVVATVARLLAVDLGPRADSTLTMRMLLPRAVYNQAAHTRETLERLRARVEAIDGVDVMGMGSLLPGSGETGIGLEIRPEGFPRVRDSHASFLQASPGYFRALGIPILRGRAFTPEDRTGSVPVAIINESAARTYWPEGIEPVGRRFTLNLANVPHALTVVGVARDVRFRGPEREAGPQVYLPFGQVTPFGTIYAAVATNGDPVSFVPAIREAVRAIDADLPIYEVQPYKALVDTYVAERRFAMLMLAGFGVMALVLAAVGLYGVMAYLVALRTREIGIRVALGARPGQIRRQVLVEGLALALAGIGAGSAAAALLIGTLRAMVAGLEETPGAFVAAAVVMSAVAALATWVPAYRATRVDPVVTLRAE